MRRYGMAPDEKPDPTSRIAAGCQWLIFRSHDITLAFVALVTSLIVIGIGVALVIYTYSRAFPLVRDKGVAAVPELVPVPLVAIVLFLGVRALVWLGRRFVSDGGPTVRHPIEATPQLSERSLSE